MQIDLGWIKKELDAGRKVELEGRNGGFIVKDNYVLSVEGDCLVVSFGVGKMWFSPDSFKYFRIKRTTPTFDDLMDSALLGLKKGFIGNLFFEGNYIEFDSPEGSFCYSRGEEEKGIAYIDSLSTESFEINSEEDLLSCKIGAKGVLSNGVQFKCNQVARCTIRGAGWEVTYNGGYNAILYLDELKGATVTQNRARKEIL